PCWWCATASPPPSVPRWPPAPRRPPRRRRWCGRSRTAAIRRRRCGARWRRRTRRSPPSPTRVLAPTWSRRRRRWWRPSWATTGWLGELLAGLADATALEAAQRLTAYACDAGGHDNVTVVVADVGRTGPPGPQGETTPDGEAG